jgi:tight adherence protein B
MNLAFSILLFFAVALFIVGLGLEQSGAGARTLAARLRGIGRGHAADLPRVSAERDFRYSTLPWLDRVLRGLNAGQHLEFLLYQAGMSMRAGVLSLLMAVGVVSGYLVGLLVSHHLLPALVCMLIVGPIPYVYVRYRKYKRMKTFAREFPDALDLLVSGLRAGLSFSAALQIVAEESPDPVRGEFAVLIEEQALGLDFREAMTNLTQRVDVLDLRFFVTAVLLQRETGGNLAEVLSNTATLIRERFRVLGDIQTFTAQGKLTGAILVCLPIGVGLMTAMVAPDYFRPMIESHGGRVALWWAASMQLLGILAIIRIVNIRV